MKSLLFVINTFGIGGGGENALLELFNQINLNKYRVELLVLTNQGDLIGQLPQKVKVLNKKYYPITVLDHKGKIRLFKTVIQAMLVRGTVFKRMGYILKNLGNMIINGKIRKEKLLWKILADSAQRIEKEYDLAVAYLEGGSTYYVDSYVKAKKKAAFIHTNYKLAGYSRNLDEQCYLDFDCIFTVSESVKEAFLSVYPECTDKTEVFYNLMDKEKIVRKAEENGGFSDGYKGFRILSVGRLIQEKAYDVEINTMKILKEKGRAFRWYVLGEGDMRKKLEKQIRRLGLEEDFILLGNVDNPFPYYAQCDLYVHASYLEGKSVAVEEAQILGCAIVVSDYNGAGEQIENGVDGRICRLEPDELAEEILYLAEHSHQLAVYGDAAAKRSQRNKRNEIQKLLALLSEPIKDIG